MVLLCSSWRLPHPDGSPVTLQRYQDLAAGALRRLFACFPTVGWGHICSVACALREYAVYLLQRLGLGQHADNFEREEVELDILSTLSDADLVALGVGHAGAMSVIVFPHGFGTMPVLSARCAECSPNGVLSHLYVTPLAAWPVIRCTTHVHTCDKYLQSPGESSWRRLRSRWRHRSGTAP